MELKVLLIEKFKNHTLCWYPSAGVDFNAINHWNAGHGNELNPTVFIYTDIDYADFSEGSICLAGENHWPTNNITEYFLDIIEDLSMFGSLTEYIQFLIPADNEIVALIKPHVHTPEEDERIQLFEQGLLGPEGVINLDDVDSPFTTAQGILLKNISINTNILFLKTTNKAFYKFCKSNMISISCLMVKEPEDDFINNKGIRINELNIREVCVREQDTGSIDFPAENVPCEPFIWSSPCGDEQSHFVKQFPLE